MGDFDGMAALVTGGASGIGAAAADLLAERGARTAVLDLEPGDGGRHLGVACDVSARAAVGRAVARVADTLGGLDVVVNNAGIGAQGDVAANDDVEWHQVLDVNVVGLPDRALYAAGKGAVLALTLAMAADHLATASGSTASPPARPRPPGSGGCCRAPATPRPPWPPCAPASPWAGWSPPPRSRRRSPTWPAPRPAPPPGPPWSSTAAWPACASPGGPRGG